MTIINTTHILKRTVPFIILFALLVLLYRELFYAKPSELPSVLIGEPVPNFQLKELFQPQRIFTPNDLPLRVSLLNVWATWCYACSLEQAMLMKIKQQYHVPIYGIDYKDKPEEAKNWLQQKGNPYVMIGNDDKGDAAIDLGVYGTPETFVISPERKIIYRHIGVLDQKTWDEVLLPIIQHYQSVPN